MRRAQSLVRKRDSSTAAATDATHKLEALVLVRGHQHRQRNILLARQEAHGATS